MSLPVVLRAGRSFAGFLGWVPLGMGYRMENFMGHDMEKWGGDRDMGILYVYIYICGYMYIQKDG